MRKAWKERSILPGFGISMGFTVLYLSLIVLFPLSAIFIKTSGMGWSDFWGTIADERVIASLKNQLRHVARGGSD